MHGIVEIVGADDLTVQEAVLGPSDLSASLLVDQQPCAQLLRLDVEEAGQLGQVHGGVQAEVRLDRGVPHVRLDLVHEDGQVVLEGVHVELGVVEVGRRGRDELRAGRAEQLLVDGQSLGATSLQLQELVAVLLPERRVDRLVEPGGVESHADGNQRVHLVVLLRDGIVLRVLLEVLGARDVDEDVAEHAHGIGVAAHHHVREAHVVVGREVRGHDTGEHGLLVELDVVQGLQRETEVPQEAVDPQEADDGEVSEHAVEGLGAIVACHGHGLLVALHGGQLLVDLRSLDQGVEDVEDAVAAPGVGRLAEDGDLFVVVALAREAVSVGAEGVELVDELVNDIPSPVVLQRTSVQVSSPSRRSVNAPRVVPGQPVPPSSR